jgi:hypothetical protein
MSIGYGSISSYHSSRHDLFFDETTHSAYFEADGCKYTIKLNDMYITNINQNKKIWIILSQKKPSINVNAELDENDIIIKII